MNARNAPAMLWLVLSQGACVAPLAGDDAGDEDVPADDAASGPGAAAPDAAVWTPDSAAPRDAGAPPDAAPPDAATRLDAGARLDVPTPRDAGADDTGGADPRARDAGRDDRGTPAAAGSVRVEPGPIDDAELVRRLPIGTTENSAPRRVVLRLDASTLPSLRVDDVLMAAAEVQVTTACDVGQSGPMCGYSPNVAAQIVLTGDRDDTDAAGPESRGLSAVVRTTVTSAEHHVVLAFRAAAARATLAGGYALPCLASGRCHVNLVMWAWDARARSGGADILLVGENEGNFLSNGVIQGDKGRLMAIRERRVTGADRTERETAGGGSIAMPLTAREVLVYSHQLVGAGGTMAAGEQYYVEARVVTTTTGRARFSTQMFLTRDPREADPSSLAGIAPRSISEHNGGNCTPGTSPCVTHRVAVFRATENLRGPVYVHLIARSAVPGGGGGANVTVRRSDGWLRSTRYGAALY